MSTTNCPPPSLLISEVLLLAVCLAWIYPSAYVPFDNVKLLPVPSFQVVPLSVLYCQLAPEARFVMFTWPLLVLLSPAVPVSFSSDREGVSEFNENTMTFPLVLWLPCLSVMMALSAWSPWLSGWVKETFT